MSRARLDVAHTEVTIGELEDGVVGWCRCVSIGAKALPSPTGAGTGENRSG